MKRAIALALFAAAIPAAVSAQLNTSEDPPTSFRDTREEAERNVSLGENSVAERDARLAVEAFGKCVADANPAEAHRLLTMDFNSTGYRTGLRLLSHDAERSCARKVGKSNVMRSANLLFAGAVAEALLEARAEPLNARLARSAAAKVESYAPSDAVAQCLARSLPDQVAALLATEPGSGDEQAAAQPLLGATPICARAAGITSRVELSVSAARAMIATASYRLVTAGGGPDA
jgi:hypothetical protein